MDNIKMEEEQFGPPKVVRKKNPESAAKAKAKYQKSAKGKAVQSRANKKHYQKKKAAKAAQIVPETVGSNV